MQNGSRQGPRTSLWPSISTRHSVRQAAINELRRRRCRQRKEMSILLVPTTAAAAATATYAGEREPPAQRHTRLQSKNDVFYNVYCRCYPFRHGRHADRLVIAAIEAAGVRSPLTSALTPKQSLLPPVANALSTASSSPVQKSKTMKWMTRFRSPSSLLSTLPTPTQQAAESYASSSHRDSFLSITSEPIHRPSFDPRLSTILEEVLEESEKNYINHPKSRYMVATSGATYA